MPIGQAHAQGRKTRDSTENKHPILNRGKNLQESPGILRRIAAQFFPSFSQLLPRIKVRITDNPITVIAPVILSNA